MAFTSDELYVGMVAYFSVKLLRDDRMIYPHHVATNCLKPRPFVCYAEADGLWYWTHLTGTPKPSRCTVGRQHLRLPPEAQSRLFGHGDLIVGDGKTSFVGPAEAFARQSKRHDAFDGLRRPVLLPAGVEQLCAIVRAYGGLLPEENAIFAPPARQAA